MRVHYKPARHGTAYRVHVEGCRKSPGIVRRTAGGTWSHQWGENEPEVPGFATRTDAVVALLLMWGGRGGTPKAADVYRWVLKQGRATTC